ncbi:hypothetical protein CesoFtcFv8_020660 [Champsocephalus esox]|uniref:Uncharacterized protein n=1 Tax=Champsocephalus esox TaxID=159716 RepID=A0AAN8BB97_9TELE|nr:hypothetical protein CesoFtcFv8_020660 [Champsocephalus esox]
MRDSGRESGADGRGASQRLSTGRVRCGETLGARLEGGETPLEDGLECGWTGGAEGAGVCRRLNRLGGPVEQEREQESLGPATEREQESDGPPTEQEPPGVGGPPLRERGGRDLFFYLSRLHVEWLW